MSEDQLQTFADEKGFLKWFETSAKENRNIDEALKSLVDCILENDARLQKESKAAKEQPSGRIIRPGRDDVPPAQSSGSCCN